MKKRVYKARSLTDKASLRLKGKSGFKNFLKIPAYLHLSLNKNVKKNKHINRIKYLCDSRENVLHLKCNKSNWYLNVSGDKLK